MWIACRLEERKPESWRAKAEVADESPDEYDGLLRGAPVDPDRLGEPLANDIPPEDAPGMSAAATPRNEWTPPHLPIRRCMLIEFSGEASRWAA